VARQRPESPPTHRDPRSDPPPPRETPTVVDWPADGADPRIQADPYDDPCWASFDTEGRFEALWAAWDAWRRGGPRAAFDQAARDAGLTEPVLADRNRPDWGHPVPSLAVLIRLATDHWPAAGMEGPERVLGPGALGARRTLRAAAVAGCAFLRSEDWPFSPFHIWTRTNPQPRAALRAAVRQVQLAPWALWRFEGPIAGPWTLVDHTGLGAAYLPEGPVTPAHPLPPLPDGTARPAGIAARVLRGPDGWVAHCVVPLPVLPERAILEGWLRDETWLARTFQPGVTRESLLRRRPILIRRTFEHAAFGRSPPHAG
jgi:hypothetical protein